MKGTNPEQPATSPDRNATIEPKKEDEHGDFPTQIADKYQTIEELYGQLQEQVSSLERRVGAAVERGENELLAPYKARLSVIQNELEGYKTSQAKQEWTKKYEAAIAEVKKQLQSCREEMLRLTEVVAGQKGEMAKLRFELKTVEGEREFLENKLKSAEKEKKAMKLSLMKSQRFVAELPKEPIVVREEGGEGEEDACGSKREKIGIDDSDKMIESIKEMGLDKEASLEKCRSLVKGVLSRHEDIVRKLKNQLSSERKTNCKLKALLARAGSEKSDLEQVFYDCVTEVRKEVNKRRLDQTRSVKLDCESSRNCAMDNFGSRDKMKIMETFLTNEQLTSTLFQAVFNNERKLREKTLPAIAIKGLVKTEDRDTPKPRNKPGVVISTNVSPERGLQISLPRNFRRKLPMKRSSVNYNSKVTPKYVIKKGRLLVSKTILQD